MLRLNSYEISNLEQKHSVFDISFCIDQFMMTFDGLTLFPILSNMIFIIFLDIFTVTFLVCIYLP